jgi:hypothetical protein
LQSLRSAPANFYQQLQVRTYDDCLASVTPSIAGIRRQLGKVGEASVRALLNIIIIDLVNFLNVGKSMNNEQVIQTVDLILQDYWMLKPDDFKLCFNNVKKGVYGKVYDRVDGMLILEWLAAYTDGRLTYSENKVLDKHSNFITDARNSIADRENRVRDEQAKQLQAKGFEIINRKNEAGN